MEETRKRRLLIILFFGMIAWLFVGFIYLALTGPRDPRYRQRLEDAAARYKKELDTRRSEDTINIFLSVGKRVRVDDNVMIYRGLENRMALVDVFITLLDPQTSYRHRIAKSDTGKIVRLGGHDYQIKSISASRLRLKRLKN